MSMAFTTGDYDTFKDSFEACAYFVHTVTETDFRHEASIWHIINPEEPSSGDDNTLWMADPRVLNNSNLGNDLVGSRCEPEVLGVVLVCTNSDTPHKPQNLVRLSAGLLRDGSTVSYLRYLNRGDDSTYRVTDGQNILSDQLKVYLRGYLSPMEGIHVPSPYSSAATMLAGRLVDNSGLGTIKDIERRQLLATKLAELIFDLDCDLAQRTHIDNTPIPDKDTGWDEFRARTVAGMSPGPAANEMAWVDNYDLRRFTFTQDDNYRWFSLLRNSLPDSASGDDMRLMLDLFAYQHGVATHAK